MVYRNTNTVSENHNMDSGKVTGFNKRERKKRLSLRKVKRFSFQEKKSNFLSF